MSKILPVSSGPANNWFVWACRCNTWWMVLGNKSTNRNAKAVGFIAGRPRGLYGGFMIKLADNTQRKDALLASIRTEIPEQTGLNHPTSPEFKHHIHSKQLPKPATAISILIQPAIETTSNMHRTPHTLVSMIKLQDFALRVTKVF